MAFLNLKHLQTLPLGWRIYWALFVSLIVLLVVQESTFIFYGPHRIILGVHQHSGTVSCSWPYSILFFLVPITWLSTYCVSSTVKQLLVIFLGLLVGVAIGIAIGRFYEPAVLARSGWEYNVGPGPEWYGQIESKTLLSWIADPIGEIKPYLILLSIGVWFVPLILPNRQLRRAEKAIRTNTCFYCNYDLRTTTSGQCPECGKSQPSLREFY